MKRGELIVRLFLLMTTLLGCTDVGIAQTYTVLYAFKGGADGTNPRTGLVQDSMGNLYGTTLNGGNSNCGTVFKLTKTGEHKVLYSFNCKPDGNGPTGLILDSRGNLYGTTHAGGTQDAGTVFKVAKSGKEKVIYSFCSLQNCLDGDSPSAGVIQDTGGNLYGTTFGGGTANGGVVFRLTKSGKETIVHNFSGPDGSNPLGGLVRDAEGNFFGTTSTGGAHANGVVFELNKSGSEKVLYSFCAQQNCKDGQNPIAGVIRDSKGNLYGTSSGDEIQGCQGNACGVVFKLSITGKEAVLHSFTGGPDGGEPLESGVIRDANGNLYGTTLFGGSANLGVLFRISNNGTETVLYNFCSQSGCTDGATPNSGVIRGADENLYGTAYYGGNLSCNSFGNGCGVVFKVKP